MFYHPNFYLNLCSYLTALLAVVAVFGDYLVARSQAHIFQAVFDNVTHAVVGGLSWLIVSINNKPYSSLQILLEVISCALLASLIDLDHFLVAKTFSLKKATSLDYRPPLHSSTVPLITAVLIICLGYILQISWLKRSGLIVLTAFASHHTRDATRRGYWFHPFGSTPHVPYVAYVLITCVIPILVSALNAGVKILEPTSKSYDSLEI